MLDWMTLTIEAIGVAILAVFIVVPLREFRQILTEIRKRGQKN